MCYSKCKVCKGLCRLTMEEVTRVELRIGAVHCLQSVGRHRPTVCLNLDLIINPSYKLAYISTNGKRCHLNQVHPWRALFSPTTTETWKLEFKI